MYDRSGVGSRTVMCGNSAGVWNGCNTYEFVQVCHLRKEAEVLLVQGGHL